mmetsp:Transcript_88682/g.214954  ORF Transcript_88682/g.214954 Transcript_88682/m.214954 type:complete len:230 (-) Transcript_88682:1375-2064(-)
MSSSSLLCSLAPRPWPPMSVTSRCSRATSAGNSVTAAAPGGAGLVRADPTLLKSLPVGPSPGNLSMLFTVITEDPRAVLSSVEPRDRIEPSEAGSDEYDASRSARSSAASVPFFIDRILLPRSAAAAAAAMLSIDPCPSKRRRTSFCTFFSSARFSEPSAASPRDTQPSGIFSLRMRSLATSFISVMVSGYSAMMSWKSSSDMMKNSESCVVLTVSGCLCPHNSENSPK